MAKLTLYNLLVLIFVLSSPVGAAVFVQTNDGVTTDPLSVQTNIAGRYFASANWSSGEFKAMSIASTPYGQEIAYAGTHGGLQFIFENTSGVSQTLGAGAFNIHIEANYARPTGPGDSSGTTLLTVLNIWAGSQYSGAQITHSLAEAYLNDGSLFSSRNTVTTDQINNAFTSYSILQSTDSRLVADMSNLELLMAPGDKFRVTYMLQAITTSSGAAAITDAANTASFSLVLPDGFTVNTANGQLAWVSEVPLPASAWLLGSALLGLLAIKRRDRDNC